MKFGKRPISDQTALKDFLYPSMKRDDILSLKLSIPNADYVGPPETSSADEKYTTDSFTGM